MICPICANEEFSPALVKDLRQCFECGLWRREAPPTRNELRVSMAAMALKAQTCLKSRNSRFEDARQQLRILDMKPGTVYDVGAAGGFFLKVAREAGWTVYGNEISQVAIAYAKEEYGIELDYGLLEEVALPPVDAVVLWNTLEHTIDPLQTMRICANMLRPGGRCIISVPMKSHDQLRATFANAHLSEFAPHSLSLCCRRAGLEEIRSWFEDQPTSRQGLSKWRLTQPPFDTLQSGTPAPM